MHSNRKGGDLDQYRLRKGDYDYERGDRGEIVQRESRGDRGRPRGQRGQFDGQKRRNLDWRDGLMDFVKPGGNIKRMGGTFIPSKRIQPPKKMEVLQEKPLPKIYRKEYTEVKNKMDSQLDDYHRNGPMKESNNHEQMMEIQDNPRKNRDNYRSHQDNNRARDEHPYIKKEERGGNRRGNVERERRQEKKNENSDDSDWSLEDKSEVKVDKDKNQTSNWFQQDNTAKEQSNMSNLLDAVKDKSDNSNWIQDDKSDKDDKNTSETNAQKSRQKKEEENLFEVDRHSQEKDEKDKSSIAKGLFLDEDDDEGESIKFESSSLNNAHIHGGDVSQFSSLLNNQNFIEDLEQDQKDKREKQKQQLLKKKQELMDKIDTFKNEKIRAVNIKFEAEDNILQFIVRKIELIPLGITMKIHSNGSLQALKQQIGQQDLEKYIKMTKTRHLFPKMLINRPEYDPHRIEGEEQNEPEKVISSCQFQLCRIKVPPQQLAHPIDEQLLAICSVTIFCMNCQKYNEITVISKENIVQCSCCNCGEAIVGKIVSLWFSDIQ